jgi:hypothetical protein
MADHAGSPWPVSKPHNYVLFEWDTYLASMIAAHVDPWVAKSNIIRMTKSLISFDGGYASTKFEDATQRLSI